MFWSKNTVRSLSSVLLAVKPEDIGKHLTAYMLAALGLLAVNQSTQADYSFGLPMNLGPTVNSSAGEGAPSISANGLALFFTSLRTGGRGLADIWVTTRATVSDPWEEPMNLGSAVNSYAWDGEHSISGDGLSLYFCSQRSGGRGMTDVWMTTRVTTSDPWEQAVNLGAPVNTSADEVDACISIDGLSLYIESNRAGGQGGNDLWVATRETQSEPWGEPVNLGPTVNSSASDGAASLSADGRMLFFSDHPTPRPGGHGGTDIWVMTRATTSDPWGEPINLGPAVNSPANDQGPNISADGSTLYFFSTRAGGAGDFDLWQVSIEPVVDFTDDYRVDIEDLLLLIEHWGQNEPAYDMGPMPWGDGVVDAADLEVLMRYWGQELPDPYFVAHWKLDESEGMHAKDSIGNNQGIVLGNAVWQPGSGQKQGALEFDGVNDVVILKSVLDPADGPFSIFAWIKGGAPGQVIISQQNGVNWIQADADGTIMTELTKSGGRTPGTPLYSETIVTDGKWHRVGFVWDDAQRILYVDDIPVALDTQPNLGSSKGGLAIGVGKDNQAGTFWSGMIDDVRIYNRVVIP